MILNFIHHINFLIPLKRTNCQSVSDNLQFSQHSFIGGGRHKIRISSEVLLNYINHDIPEKLKFQKYFYCLKYIRTNEISTMTDLDKNYFTCHVPLDVMIKYMNVKEIQELSKIHGISLNKKELKKSHIKKFHQHCCPECYNYTFVFSPTSNDNTFSSNHITHINQKEDTKTLNSQIINTECNIFPPDPPSKYLVERIITGFCNDIQPIKFMEADCAVCGQLSPFSKLHKLNETSCNLDILCVENIGRKERKMASDPIVPLSGRILDPKCENICNECENVLLNGKIPSNALAHGIWIGEIPQQLQDLTLIESMLISRVCHNRCVVRVSYGRAKMTANAIMFMNPSAKIYHILPPT